MAPGTYPCQAARLSAVIRGRLQSAAPSVEGALDSSVSRDGWHCRFFRSLQTSTPGLKRAQTLAAAQLGDSVAAFFIGLIASCSNLLRSWECVAVFAAMGELSANRY